MDFVFTDICVCRNYEDELLQYVSKCDAILKEVDKVLSHLEKLEKQHVFVSTQTRALHDACEQSLQDQVLYSDLLCSTKNNLIYFLSSETGMKKSTSTSSVSS